MNVSIASIKIICYIQCVYAYVGFIYIYIMQMMIHLPAQLCLFFGCDEHIFTLCVV